MAMSSDTVTGVTASAEVDAGGVFSASTHERNMRLTVQSPDETPTLAACEHS